MLFVAKKLPPIMLYDKLPKIGMVIGTYGSTSYVELQLEAMQRFNPGTPILIHDDGSSRFRDLAILAQRYGVDLHYSTYKAINPKNHPARPGDLGDLCSYVQGLTWAKGLGLNLLVKVSRRWITLKPWIDQLQQLAVKTQFPTYSSYCVNHSFGFRTESMAMAVKQWFDSKFMEETLELIRTGDNSGIVEQHMHYWAQKVMEDTCQYNKNLLSLLPVDIPFGGCMRGYGVWSSMLGDSRTNRRSKQLWHETHTPSEYAAAANSLGLDLKTMDFQRFD